MTKKAKEGLDSSVDAFSKLMGKYKREGAVYEAPESLEDIDVTVSRLKNPILSFDRYLGGAPAYGKMTTFSALASCGKCLAKGTKVLMYDGTYKKVEDIKVGEQLMGVDSTPRNVLNTVIGSEQMYWIRQSNSEDYRVNESHILSLKKISQPTYRSKIINGKRVYDKNQKLEDRKEEVINIPLLELLNKYTEKSIYKRFKGYRVGALDFNHIKTKDLLIEPYMVGLWLGDGTSSKPEITNIDEEVEDYICSFAEKNNQKVTVYKEKNKADRFNIVTNRGQDNPFLNNLKYYKLINNKHVPRDYKFSSLNNRLELLAGIIDSDGSLNNNTRYDIIQKNKELAKDIQFIAKSCGLHCTLVEKKCSIKSTDFEGIYYRLQITGDVSIIPCKIKRKIQKEKKSNRVTTYSSIKIEKDVVDNYYGFEIDGDSLFILEDFTVTHNTSLALLFAGANPDKKIGFVDNEFNWDDASYLWIDKYFGIEKERIIVLQPEYLEEGAEMVVDLCDAVDILIYDGFDSLAPKAEYEGTMEDNTMGLQARVYKKFFRKSMSKIYNSKTAFIVTNHLYENIGNMYEPFKEPGGKGIHDYASQKLYLTRSNITDKDKKIIGQNVNININKDKLTGNRGTKFDIPYDNKRGFDIELDILNNAVDLKIVDQKGAYFYYDGTLIGQGKDNVKKTFLDNPELVLEISNRCRELF